MKEHRAKAVEEREKLEIPGLSGIERSLLVAPPSSSGKPPTKPVIAAPGASPLLSRLQNFLPAMQTANQDLLHLPPASLSMELEGEDEQPHISMDLSCGLFDLKTAEAAQRAERIMNGTAGELPPPPSDEDSSSDSDSNCETDAAEERSGSVAKESQEGGLTEGGRRGRGGAPRQPRGSQGQARGAKKKNLKIREL